MTFSALSNRPDVTLEDALWVPLSWIQKFATKRHSESQQYGPTNRKIEFTSS
jgi:hypothetical protein